MSDNHRALSRMPNLTNFFMATNNSRGSSHVHAGTNRSHVMQGDLIRISELQQELHGFKQGNLSVTDYFSKLKILWQELDVDRPFPRCVCPVQCACESMRNAMLFREQDRIIRFLTGLSDSFKVVKNRILSMEPLPPLNTVFSIVLQRERQVLNNNGLSDRWILGTAATDHICKSIHLFSSSLRRLPVAVEGQLADGSSLFANYVGDVRLTDKLLLTDVLFLPEFNSNVISVPKLTRSLNCSVIMGGGACFVQDKHSRKLASGKFINGLCYLDTQES